MGSPVIVMGDAIVAVCPPGAHQVPGPTGTPAPSPAPLPFRAPIIDGCVATVQVGGHAVAVVGASGVNSPPHVGLHLSDPFASPTAQRGTVASGSATVSVGGFPAATAASSCTACVSAAQAVPSIPTVTIG